MNLAKRVKERIYFLAENKLYSHIVAFAYFCDRQARKYAAAARAADWAADAAADAADWVAADAARAAADAADAAADAADWAAADAADWAAADAAWAAADAAGAAVDTASRRQQLEFLEWIWATTKQHWKTKKFKRVGGLLL